MPRTEEVNQQTREQRKARILAGAANVIARKGLAAAKIADIAAATDMSQGLIYRYFASKDELFAALVEQALAGVADLARQAHAQPGSAWDRIRWFNAQLVQHQYAQPAYSLVVAHALTNEAIPPAVRAMARRHLNALREVITELVAAGQADGQVTAGEPDHLALLYLSTLHGLSALAAFIDEPAAGFPDAASVLHIFTPVGRENSERITP